MTFISGDTHLMYWRERRGNPYGDTESFYVKFVPSHCKRKPNPEKDMLFIGGDFAREPFRPLKRVIPGEGMEKIISKNQFTGHHQDAGTHWL